SIYSRLSDVSIWKTYFQDKKVYFCGMEAIFVFDPATAHVSILETPDNGFFSFFLDQELYVGDYGSGLMKLEGSSFAVVPGGGFFEMYNISGLVPLDTPEVLVATLNKGLFLMDLEKGTVDSTFLIPALKEEFGAATIVTLQIHENNIYVGTLNEGLFILDRQGNLRERYSEREGLLNNSIMQVHIPHQNLASNSIWISHWMGISKADIHSPFRSMPVGQSGRGYGGRNTGELITDITEFQGQLFVATMGGLHRRSDNTERPGFRPVRGIRGAIFDLQVLEPEPGLEFLLACTEDQTFVLDRNLRLSKLEVGGKKLLSDPDNPSVFYTGQAKFTGFRYQNGQWKEFIKVDLERDAEQMCLDKYGFIWISNLSGLFRLDISEAG
ncbi:MAG: hypothetical protein KAT15_30575, partial [Bacteroidales bacterium]|nr:hypothetical protein [Bacteroidales bacterium]